MAVNGIEVDALPTGTNTSSPSKGDFVLNAIWRHEAWEVRKGFGQISQLDSSMSLNKEGAAVEWGYREHLGSKAILTDFGHTQIVSVFRAVLNTGQSTYHANRDQFTHSQEIDGIAVSIYDVTTNSRWEEILGRGTSEGVAIADIRSDHGGYETTLTRDYQAWSSGSKKQAFFSEVNDILFFGNAEIGIFSYFVTAFPANRPKTVSNAWEHEWTPDHYSEGSVVRKLEWRDGLFAEAYTYLRSADIGGVTSITTLGSRMAFSSGKRVYFSDPGFPATVIASNYILVPSQRDVNAIVEQLGNLLIFTESEMYHYRPSVGDLASNGSLVRLSDTVGCSGCCSITRDNHEVLWSDRNGIYTHTGNMQIKKISGGIDDFFTSFTPSPLSSFSLNDGATTMATTQPLSTLRYDPDGVNIASYPQLNAILVSVPKAGVILCRVEEKWSYWSVESIVNVEGGSSSPGAKTNIQNPWLIAAQDRLFLVGSTDDQVLTDASKYRGDADVNNDTTSSSYYLLEYGRGGGIDRSVGNGASDRSAALEDMRIVSGMYVRSVQVPVVPPYFIIDKPIQCPAGYTLPGGTVVSTSDVVWLVPIRIVPDEYTYSTADYIDKFSLTFRYDYNQWSPIYKAGGNREFDFILPPERTSSVNGYNPGAPVAGGRVDAASANDATVSIVWDGTNAAGADWANHPFMNLRSHRISTLLYLPFKRDNATADLSSMGIFDATPTSILRDIGGTITADTIWWEQWSLGLGTPASPGSVRTYDTVAQPVDWALVSPNLAFDTPRRTWPPKSAASQTPIDTMVKLRSIYSDLMSHGKATDRLEPLWLHGIYNVAFTADGRMWMSQVVDHDGVSKYQEVDKTTLRERIRHSNGLLQVAVFNTQAASYGDKAVPATGRYIIGNEQFSRIVTSGNVKGQYVQVMQFGFVQNRAEAMKIQNTVASLRLLGGRRRRSH